MRSTVVVDCPKCSVRVNAEVRGSVGYEDDSAHVLVCCPSCRGALFGATMLFRDESGDWSYDHAERLWPTPSVVDLSPAIPEAARRDLKDAQKCIAHGIFSAATVLCGRALERLVAEKTGSATTLAKGLQTLKEAGTIDNRLFLWAEALRRERNIGAHATVEESTRENAQDVLDFSIAISEYVYTLAEKYERYIARKSK